MGSPSTRQAAAPTAYRSGDEETPDCGGAVVGCTATTTTVGTKAVEGSLVLKEMTNVDNPTCRGRESYDDINEGAQVVVKDETGAIIATSSLSGGTPVTANLGGYCQFTFQVTVPADRDFYSFEVSHRGELTYSNAEMESMGWTVAFELGG